jgi:hypothetical protein
VILTSPLLLYLLDYIVSGEVIHNSCSRLGWLAVIVPQRVELIQHFCCSTCCAQYDRSLVSLGLVQILQKVATIQLEVDR